MNLQRQRILFVDDEPMILSALRNLLYKDRDRWELAFSTGGEGALAEMRSRPFDVIVSDMRMPGMDGAALLEQVKREFPMTARIMLSGHADRATIVGALPSLHQLLSKPCDRDVLRSTLERCTGAAMVPRLRAAIYCLEKLPSPRALCQQLAALPVGATTADVLDIVRRDQGLAAKVLQLVNSSYFGSKQRTTSVEVAVARLGPEQLRYIALATSVFSAMDETACSDALLSGLQRASVAVAQDVRRFVSGPDQDEAFTSALLLHVGHVVLALGLPDAYALLCEGRSELELFGTTHAEIGATLLGLWGLPDRIVDAVRYHHDPGAAPSQSSRVAVAVHLAAALGTPHDLDAASVARAGCPDLVDAWRAIVTAQST